MRNRTKRKLRKIGLPPGTPIYLGEAQLQRPSLTLFVYNEAEYQETEPETLAEACNHKNAGRVLWLNIDGIHDAELIENLGKTFLLHSLLLEDIMHTDQRPKVENYDSHIFVVLKMLSLNGLDIVSEQISLILGDGYVVSFQESNKDGDVFEPIRQRIRTGKGRVRKAGADYLLYALLDVIIDNYYLVLDRLNDEIDRIDIEIWQRPNAATLSRIHALRRELTHIHKNAWPLVEMIGQLKTSESDLLCEPTNLYLRDALDHITQIHDTIEIFRDTLSEQVSTYMSFTSQKTNEAMKVLTMISTIFIPITFIAGLYGMNFEFMPELRSPWGYPLTLLIMLAVALGILYYFKREKWL